MFESLIKKIFGDPNEKELKNIQPIVDKINALEPDMERMSDTNLKSKTAEFKLRLQKGEPWMIFCRKPLRWYGKRPGA